MGSAGKTQQTVRQDQALDSVLALADQLGGLTQHAACSACAGDYENPEHSAPPEEFLDEEYEGAYEAGTAADERTGAQ